MPYGKDSQQNTRLGFAPVPYSDNVITQNQILWNKCVAFSVDSGSVNISKRIETQLKVGYW
jgi:hypothetical protein